MPATSPQNVRHEVINVPYLILCITYCPLRDVPFYMRFGDCEISDSAVLRQTIVDNTPDKHICITAVNFS